MKHCDCSPFVRPASFAQLAMAAYTPLLAIETTPSPFCSGADILPLTMGRFAPEAVCREFLFRGSRIGLAYQSPLPDIARCFADRLEQKRHADGAGVNAEMRGHLQHLQDFPVVSAEF